MINNITRSASLFLTKTIFSALLSVLLLIMPSAYPFQPIQLTLFSSLAIGIPSFILALEPNTARVKGKFLLSVLERALPAALTIVLGTVACMIMAGPLGHDMSEVSTMAVIFTVCVGLISLVRVCWPFNLIRAAPASCASTSLASRNSAWARALSLSGPMPSTCAGVTPQRWNIECKSQAAPPA